MKKILIVLLMICSFTLMSCSKNEGTYEEVSLLKEMRSSLSLYFDEEDIGVIRSDMFFLKGYVFVAQATDNRSLKVNYNFSDNSYFTLEYKEKLGYDKNDIFGNEISSREEGYIGRVIKYPAADLELDCEVSITYKTYTVSKQMKVKMNGGENMILSSNGWKKSKEFEYIYNKVNTHDPDKNGITSKYEYYGYIDLNSMKVTYDYEVTNSQSNGKSWNVTDNRYTYDILTGQLTIVTKTQTMSINLKTYSTPEKYQTDYNNDWDWMRYLPVSVIEVCDQLLVLHGYESYVSIF